MLFSHSRQDAYRRKHGCKCRMSDSLIRVLRLWSLLGRLTALIWHPRMVLSEFDNYISNLRVTTEHFLDAFNEENPKIILNHLKLHLLAHLPFGVPATALAAPSISQKSTSVTPTTGSAFVLLTSGRRRSAQGHQIPGSRARIALRPEI